MRFLINVPSNLIPKVSTWLLKLGIELEAVPVVETTPAAPSRSNGTKAPAAKAPRLNVNGKPLAKGMRNFKCRTTDASVPGHVPAWTANNTTDKLAYADRRCLCEACHEADAASDVTDNFVNGLYEEVERTEEAAGAAGNTRSWSEDDVPESATA